MYYNESLHMYNSLNMYGYPGRVCTMRNLVYLLIDTKHMGRARALIEDLNDMCTKYLKENNLLKVSAIYLQGLIFYESGKRSSVIQNTCMSYSYVIIYLFAYPYTAIDS